MKNYTETLNQAKHLPTHVNGMLQPQHVMFRPCISYSTMYSDQCDPVSVFNAVRPRPNGAERFYVRTEKTFRPDGSTRPKSEWTNNLMFHKKWARKDKEVTNVTFDIVGLKRPTTGLPAGVLIANVTFEIA